MRVLSVGSLYPPHHQGGYELVWQGAVEHLRARGDEVRVLATGHREPGVPALVDEEGVFRELEWYWRDHGWPRMGMRARLALERHNARVLRRHLLDQRPQLVTWWSMGGMSLSLLGQVARAGVPAAAFVHEYWLEYASDVDRWTNTFRGTPRLARAVERRTGLPTRFDPSVVERWVFVSDFVRRSALEAGFDLPRTEVAPSGIHERFLRPAPEREWAWRLLYVGRLDARKGIATAVLAVARLPAEAQLEVVGTGDERYRRALQVMAGDLGVADRVRFRGALPSVALPGVYAQADCVVFPVRWAEPWGLIPLEAMGVGRPVVATGRGGSGEYLRDGENCLLHPVDDDAALAAAVERLARDPALRSRVREGGLATAPRHTRARFHAQVERIVHEAAGAARSAEPAASPA